MKLVALMTLIALCVALDNGVALTPPMGWMAWEQFHCEVDCTAHPDTCISEKLFRDIADHLVADGYLEAGYKYLDIDDCWMAMERDKDFKLQGDLERFPSGMKNLSDYIHAKGLKFGIYNDYGTKTCGGYPGSEGYLLTDAETFAEWNVDYLKMDGCYSSSLDHTDGYEGMAYFLNSTGRPIVYSCSWPAYTPEVDYGLLVKHCNLWRNWYDIGHSWYSISHIIQHWGNMTEWRKYAGPGHWNDPDMLVIGMKDGLNYEESKTQMSLWAILAAPFLMSNDLRTIDDWAKEILLNKEVIAVDQDPLGLQGYRLSPFEQNDQVWIRELKDGEYAIAFLNMADEPLDITAHFKDFSDHATFKLRDLWLHQDLGEFTDSFTAKQVPAHGTVLLRATF